jgi:hypothetical protein
MAMRQKNVLSRMAAMFTVVGAASWMLPAAIVRPADAPASADSKALLGVVVTDQNPADLLAANKLPSQLDPGPFNGPATTQLYVIAIYDRTRLGNRPFDQRVRFTLPDGHVYETRIDPVDPRGVPAQEMVREDLASHPVPVLSLTRAKRLARLLMAGQLKKQQLRNVSIVTIPLPVSGTWITGHSLYGTWQIEIAAMQEGRAVSSTNTRVVIDNIER